MKHGETAIPRAEELERERREAVRAETEGMSEAFAALQPLNYNSRRRALRWLNDALEDAEPPF